LSIATDKETDRTAYHMLMEYVRLDDTKNRIFVVHRLDRETSGVLVVAKNEQIKRLLQDNWSEIVVSRGYVALAEGKLEAKSGTIKSWLLETKTHMMYSSYTKGDGLEAITDYKVVQENDNYSLLDIRLQTGRKNQIRVHMHDINHSIAGDKKYGAMSNPMKRLCLHAYLLEIKHPVTGEIMHFETEIPSAFISLSR
ncbi:MAG: RNA pseudouridine synthase, partial [Christensenellaceae bacterium]